MASYLRALRWRLRASSSIVLATLTKTARACMERLQEWAKVVAQTNQPIFWKTPSGFVVRHFYGKLKAKMLETLVDGQRLQFKYYEHTADLSLQDQLRGISPNFTHSMDAAANMETIIRMALDNRQPPITAIHDAYGTVAGAMWRLFASVREAFIWVHQNDVLAEFRSCCVGMYRDWLMAKRPELDWQAASEIAEETIFPVPERGDLDVSVVAQSDYFFA